MKTLDYLEGRQGYVSNGLEGLAFVSALADMAEYDGIKSPNMSVAAAQLRASVALDEFYQGLAIMRANDSKTAKQDSRTAEEKKAARLVLQDENKQRFEDLKRDVCDNCHVVGLQETVCAVPSVPIIKRHRHLHYNVARFTRVRCEYRYYNGNTINVEDKNDNVCRLRCYDVVQGARPAFKMLFYTFGNDFVAEQHTGVESCIFDNNPKFEDAITQLARSVAFSVLKKCISGSGIKKENGGDKKHKSVDGGCWSPALLRLRASIVRDSHNLDSLRRASAAAEDCSFRWQLLPVRTLRVVPGQSARGLRKLPGFDFDLICKRVSSLYDVAVDSSLNKACAVIIGTNWGDGFDLVQTAATIILSELDKQHKRCPAKRFDLDRPYHETRLNRRVLQQWSDPVLDWVNVETTPMHEIFTAVRRYIRSSGHVSYNPRSGYTYIEDEFVNDADGSMVPVLVRLPKYSDLGGYVRDFSGGYGVYTANVSALQVLESTETIRKELHLSKRQNDVLDLRLRGYGWWKIGGLLNISRQAANYHMTVLQSKVATWFINHGGTEEDFNRILRGLPEYRVLEEQKKEEVETEKRLARREKLEKYVLSLIAEKQKKQVEEEKGIIIPGYYVRAYGDDALRVYVCDVEDLKSRPSFMYPGLYEGLIQGYNDYFGDWDC